MFFVALGGYLIYDLVTKTDPDVVILYIDNNAEIAYSEKFTDYLQNLCGDINDDGKAVISENDEWRDEKEWDEVFGLMQNEQKNP